MPYQNVDELPADLKDKLQDGAAQIFMAAFNAAESDGMNEESAKQVAWNSVKQQYAPDESGNWHVKPEDTNIHNKSVQSGGN